MEELKNPHDQPLIISYLTLRKAIGILGITLPAILWIGSLLLGNCDHIQASVSHYYYTIMGDVFVGILCAVAIFLLSYKGYDKLDNITSNAAGVFALCIAFFPTSSNTDILCSILQLSDNEVRIYAHFILAALFFCTLAFISIFLFTKSSGHKTPEKIMRNKVFRICGVVILVSIFLIFLTDNVSWLANKLTKYNPVFWLEWCALAAFGISWLTKGELLLADKPQK